MDSGSDSDRPCNWTVTDDRLPLWRRDRSGQPPSRPRNTTADPCRPGGLDRRRSNGCDLGGLRAFVGQGQDERNALTFGEITVALADDRRVMDEYFLASIFWSDETVAEFGVKPFNISSCHTI